VLAHVLEQSLRLLHPFMPFVTESIWQNLPTLGEQGRALIVARWPKRSGRSDPAAEAEFSAIQEIVRAIRNVRSEYNVEPARRIAAVVNAGESAESLRANLPAMAALARLAPEQVQIERELAAPDKAVTIAAGGIAVYLPLAGLVDLNAERSRLQKEIDNLDRQLQRGEGLLANPGFVNKAPDDVIQRERDKLAELQVRRGQLLERLADL
jgi:valyl-tRNA synthetase